MDDGRGCVIEMRGARLHWRTINGGATRAYSWGGAGEVWMGARKDAEAKIRDLCQMTRGAVVVDATPVTGSGHTITHG